jgi:hypothetical protein
MMRLGTRMMMLMRARDDSNLLDVLLITVGATLLYPTHQPYQTVIRLNWICDR